jgi:hypothetical protein
MVSQISNEINPLGAPLEMESVETIRFGRALRYSVMGVNSFMPLRGQIRGAVSTLGTPEIREINELRDENTRLKRLVADLTLDKVMLQDVLSKKL